MTKKKTDRLYQEYKMQAQKIADINYAAAVLDWDQETYMPPKGAAFRARQTATLAELAHQFSTGEKYGDLLQELSTCDELSAKERKNVLLSKEDFERKKKLPASFVRELSETISIAYQHWIEARKENDYSVFEPSLAKLVILKKQEADLRGYLYHPYNALLREYEKSASVSMLDDLFLKITGPLQKILQELQQKPEVDDSFLYQFYPKEAQWNWGLYLIKEMGFDFEAGRQDISEHPFTTNFSVKDVRITTRIDENDFANMNWSCIHETGHALYEQGLPDADYGLPSGEYASLSIHESQSRFWENCVGRSRAFWEYFFPKLQTRFPDQLKNISLEKFYAGINKVKPSLIRTESDELTYHFHIKIRYLIEKELMAGTLHTRDLRERWNVLYKENLGVIVPDDKSGCLQDVHWAHGSFGYFPTYSLGSFYAAQFWEKLQEERPDVLQEFSSGNLKNALSWLRQHIHAYGRLYNSEELCRNVTGKPLQTYAFVKYLSGKLS